MSQRLQMLKEMHQQDPTDSFVTYALAKEYETNNDLQAALETYILLKGNDPNYVGLYYHLGKLYEELNLRDQALIIYDEGILIGKNLSDLHAVSELMNAKTNAEMEL